MLYKGKNIAEVLDMTVEEAAKFFENTPRVARKLQTLLDVGLGYIKLGQSSTHTVRRRKPTHQNHAGTQQTQVRSRRLHAG